MASSTTPAEGASGMWRSETMTRLRVVMPREAAHDVLQAVGRVGVAQVIDLCAGATALQRPHTADIRVCEDVERGLRFLRDRLALAGMAPADLQDVGHSKPFLSAATIFAMKDEVENRCAELQQVVTALDRLRERHNAIRETLEAQNVEAPGGGAAGGFLVIGTIPEAAATSLRRMAFRVSRNNALCVITKIDDLFEERDGEMTEKVVFTVYAPSLVLTEKIKKIAAALGGRLQDYAALRATPRAQLLAQLATVEQTAEESRRGEQQLLAAATERFPMWHTAAVDEKAVFAAMNMMDQLGTTCAVEAWVPHRHIETFEAAVQDGWRGGRNDAPPVVTLAASQRNPPTYYETPELLAVFQGIVDSYGVPRYKEINPAVFTVVTFPYLFGIMFGDIGHGIMLIVAAIAMVCIDRFHGGGRTPPPMFQNEILGMIFGARYLLIAMGFFATYIGLLYNDFFGIQLQLFNTGYQWPELPPAGKWGTSHPSVPNGRPNVAPASIAVFGVDVAWTETENQLEFMNSLKMKCAIIVGVVQMMLGLVLSFMNFYRTRDMRRILFRFVPEVIFLSCTFGYMALLIIGKWSTDWTGRTNAAPSLLETMTNFFLQPGSVTVELYAGQVGMQTFLLLLAFAQVPIMLLAVPLLDRRDHKQRVALRANPLAGMMEEQHEKVGDIEEDEEFAFGDAMIHSVIHTIEFVLGCVSNTASYLRLWALSLAHAQLAEVFFNFAFVAALDSGNAAVMVIGFAVWLAATIGVLLLMESLSAFLHALRLHWVEFQNKFYAADGVAFVAFVTPG
jgi:V-type H+-transporting ATPase subunit a